MSYLIDSDWLIGFLQGNRAAIELIDHLSSIGVSMSLVSFGEIYEGIYFGSNPLALESTFLSLVDICPVVGLDEETMRRFARIRGELRRTGQVIADANILIAATSIQHGRALVTRNRKHFDRVPGLKLFDEQFAP